MIPLGTYHESPMVLPAVDWNEEAARWAVRRALAAARAMEKRVGRRRAALILRTLTDDMERQPEWNRFDES